MTSAFKRASSRVAIGVGVFAAGGVLGVVVTQQLEADVETTQAAAEPSSTHQPLGGGGLLTCAIYDVPSPVYGAPPPRSTLSDGAPYVILCEDSTGNEVVNELFIHQPPGS